MNTNSQTPSILPNFQQIHQEEIQTITQILAQITNHTSEQIKPLLDGLLERLVEHRNYGFYQTATAEEWSREFREWVDSHRTLNLPTLSDEAISRESIYGDRG
jgi:type III secretory pathway component EscR